MYVTTFQGLAHSIPKKSHVLANPLGSMKTVVLKPEFPGGSVGITLAGGTDYETKEITVYRYFINKIICYIDPVKNTIALDYYVSYTNKSLTFRYTKYEVGV